MPIDEWDLEDRVENSLLVAIRAFLDENPNRAYTALDISKEVTNRVPADDIGLDANPFVVLLEVLIERDDVVRLERLGTVYYTSAEGSS